MNIQIYVKDIGYLELDVKRFAIPLTFNIADIQDISKRKSNFSKTVKIPGSKKNNIIFKHAYEITATDTFAFNKKVDATLLVDKQPVMNGYMKLKKIEKIRIGEKYEIIYSITLHDEVKNFLDVLADRNIGDLDFSSGFIFQGISYRTGDHTYNAVNVVDSFSNTYENIYNYTLKTSTDLFRLGVDKPTPINYRIALNHTVMYPAVYMKAIFDKIFYDNNIVYNSEYLEGTSFSGFFSDMVMVYNNINLTDTIIGEWCSDGSGSLTSSDPVDLGKITSSGNMNTCSMGGYTVNGYEMGDMSYYENAVYANGIKLSTLGITNSGTTEDLISGIYELRFRIHVTNDSPSGGEGGTSSRYRVQRYRGGVSTTLLLLNTIDITIGSITESTLDVDLEDGDFIFLEIDPGVDVTVDYNGASIRLVKQQQEVLETVVTERELTIGEILPEMSQKDFILNHIRLANLYITYNAFEDKYYFEPREEFYQGGSLIDWTSKVDQSKLIEIAQFSPRDDYLFSYDEADNDDFMVREKENLKIDTYGTLTVDNDLSESVIEVGMDYDNYATILNPFTNDYYILQFSQDTGYDNKFPNYHPQTFLETAYEGNNIQGFIHQSSEQCVFGEYINGGVMNDYINHNYFNNYTGDYSKNLFWKGEITDLTGTTAYELFYEATITNYQDNNNRLISIYVDLSIEDILNLNFKNRIIINNQLYFLEKIEFDPSNYKSSKVILQKQIKSLGIDGVYTEEYLKHGNQQSDYLVPGDSTDKTIIN